MRRTFRVALWTFQPDDKKFRTARDLISGLLRDVRLLEQQVQSSRHPDRLRILLIRFQAGASLIALDLRWYSEAVRLADSFRSELEIAVMSPSLSRREGGVIGNMGPEMMRIYDHIMTGCGRQSDD